LCSSCRTARIFITDVLLAKKVLPERGELLHAFDGIKCRCLTPDALFDAVCNSYNIKKRRLYAR
jgi:carbon-monoxide dehydrogenase small subunit